MAEKIFKSPAHAPGQGVAEGVGRGVKMLKIGPISGADLDAGAVVEIAPVVPGTIIRDVLLEITQGFGSVTIEVGDTGAADKFMDSTAVAPNTTGFKSMRSDAQPGSQGYVYREGDTLLLTFGNGTPIQGSLNAWVEFALGNEWGLA